MRISKIALAALIAFGSTAPALAERGDMLIKIRGNYQLRNNSDVVAVSIDQTGGNAATRQVKVGNAAGGEGSLTFFWTDHFATELGFGGAGYSIKQVGGTRKLMNGGSIQPAITLQYHPLPAARVRPYLGVGGVYHSVYSERAGDLLTNSAPYPAATYAVSVNEKLMPVGQAGFDVSLDDKIYLNFDFKYMFGKSDITVEQKEKSNTYTQSTKHMIFGVGAGFKF